jgi:P-type E1-E2 ATPase
MTFMIVASPCAVVLATMPPLLSAIANAGRHGVLVKSAQLDEFRSAPGRGVSAVVEGHRVAVGSPARLLPTQVQEWQTGHAVAQAGAIVAELEAAGHTVVVVLVDDKPAGVLGLADQLRPAARETVHELTALTGITPTLLTGDNPRAARRLADEVGISDVRAGLLPQDKVTAVRELEATGVRLLVVGDGVNDAPAVAAAHSGIAMGRAGSDLALDTADAVVVRDELATVPAVIALSRRARRFVIANLTIAATFITGLVLWDLFGDLPLPLGVAGHEGSTVIVGLNGLRLLREAAWRRPRPSPWGLWRGGRVGTPVSARMRGPSR